MQVHDDTERAAADDTGKDAVDYIEQAWLRETPNVDVRSIGIVTRIFRLARYLEQTRELELAELGTDRASLDVLAMLRRSSAPYRMTAGELTKASLVTSGAISLRLDKLQRAGLITREFHDSDRRRVNVQLTQAGIALVDSVVVNLMDHETALLDTLADHEQADLRRLLKKLLARFESADADGHGAPRKPKKSGRKRLASHIG
ncbi:MAG: MarR family winged helix-turn-helix transcriptional regulator [Mycobacterium sp.]